MPAQAMPPTPPNPDRIDVGRDLSLQRRRQHLPGAVANNLIQNRARHIGLGRLLNYLEHWAYLPEPARQRRLLIRTTGLQIILGKVRPITSPGRGPSTGSDHCSLLAARSLWRQS